MENGLTKDADKLICLIYKEYLRRRSAGREKWDAVNFDDTDKDTEAFADFSAEDFHETLTKLKQMGLVKTYIYGDFKLEDAGIIYMEHRFPNGISQVLEWLGKIKSAIPFA